MHDLIIVGAGPAGYTASIYASRYKVSNIILGSVPGGLVTKAHMVENWPGVKSISGVELMKQFDEHAKSLGTEVVLDEAVDISKENGHFKVYTKTNKEFKGKTILLALGTEHRKLNIKGEKELLGKGVSYCTVCDAMFFKGKTVAVIGGSDAACTGALHLADIAEKVFLINRKETLRAEPIWQERIDAKENIEIIYNTNITEIIGNFKVEKVMLDKPYRNSNELNVDGVFVEIGSMPSTALALNLGVRVDNEGYIVINQEQETNIPGVFAAGDITVGLNKLRQIVTASAEGAVAATGVFKHLKEK